MKTLHKINKLLTKPLIRLIRIYQMTLSPDQGIPSLRLKGRVCSHEPHCSKYGVEVLKKHGFWPGIWYASERVLHCTPSMTINHDPSHYRVVFCSSAPIGVPFLQQLHEDSRFEVVGVVTQPDKASGRGMEMHQNIIKTEAETLKGKGITNVLLLDGFGGDGTSNRFPRLKSTLEEQGITVYNPSPKDTNFPILDDQLEYLIENYGDKINGNTAIIGHSLGCLLANHFITSIEKHIAKLICVAPAFRENNIEEIAKKFPGFKTSQTYLENYQIKTFDISKLEELVGEHIVYLSNDDPFIPIDKAHSYYTKHFKHVKINILEGKGHFNASKNIQELPEVLADIIFTYTPNKLNPEKSPEGKAFTGWLQEKRPDFLVVIAYGKILPEAILNIPTKGPINVHGSILPEYRGASPLQSVFLDNKPESGITIMKMDKEMDTGDIIDILKTPLKFERTVLDLINRIQSKGPKFLNNTLRDYGKGHLGSLAQDHKKATYCHKIEKESGFFDPETTTLQDIYNKYRAFFLWPKIYFEHKGKRIIIEEILLEEQEFQKHKDEPFLIDNELNKAIKNSIVKPEGKKKMERKDFSNGYMN